MHGRTAPFADKSMFDLRAHLNPSRRTRARTDRRAEGSRAILQALAKSRQAPPDRPTRT